MPRLYNIYNGKELKAKIQSSTESRKTISFYKYHPIPNPDFFRDFLYLNFEKLGVFGRIYVANEGINAQISVPSDNFESFRTFLYSIDFLNNLRLNIAIEDDGKSFFKLKINVRDKIVADGIEDPSFDVNNSGVHLDAKTFNNMLEDSDSVIIDMRNHYESEVGHFKNAISPDVVTFRESLPIIAEQFEAQKDKNILMYCTGGIRCEKASAYMKYRGFKNVFQLNGGIIEYARQVKEQNLENKFIGKNFVFDERLGERITDEIIAQCHQCGEPCDEHTNCANDACHILFIQCKSCADKYNHCCSTKCSDFIQLPQEEQVIQRKVQQFNGSKFSKGRYKSFNNKNDVLL